MSNKLKIILCITAFLIGGYYLNLSLKDEVEEMKKTVYSFNQPKTNIAHVEFLDNNQAIVFYEWGNDEDQHFGDALFKKNLLGWKFVSGSTGALAHGYKLDWGFSNLEHYFTDYTDLIRGKILDPEIEGVTIKSKDGNLFKANIIEYNDHEKFWFFVSDGEDLVGSTITGLSSEGKIVEQITK